MVGTQIPFPYAGSCCFQRKIQPFAVQKELSLKVFTLGYIDTDGYNAGVTGDFNPR